VGSDQWATRRAARGVPWLSDILALPSTADCRLPTADWQAVQSYSIL
jgi:hypothetical protein